MNCNGLPEKQGLYDPRFEHDACGIGLIANIKGKKSHSIIDSGLLILKNLAHRGGVGSDPDTGDGAGILIQMPHKFLKRVCKNEGIELPEPGSYGVGMLFLSPDEETRAESLRLLSKIIDEEKQKLLGVRRVPVYSGCIGRGALDAMPYIVQVFIGKSSPELCGDDFERRLYVIGKIAERRIRKSGADNYFYFASLSSRTIVYKGMLTPEQVNGFYLDLKDTDTETAIALVHSRFSTNTFPSWERAHPNRYIIHNGEINTIRGNVNRVRARESMLSTPEFENDMEKILPIINEDGSDSAMLDNYLQFLHLAGFSLPRAVMMTIPEPWENNTEMSDEMRRFYEYHSCITEAWDGPAAVAFTDGRLVGATLDRNGLRPARYYVTSDDTVILSSEAGVADTDESKIIKKERLHPGKMLLIDTEAGRIISDAEIKSREAKHKPYGEWVGKTLVDIENLPVSEKRGAIWHDLVEKIKADAAGSRHSDIIMRGALELENMFANRENGADTLPLLTLQKLFGYTWEDVNTTIKEMSQKADDPIGAMGTDIPLAVFSEKPQLLYNYFKQLFAQVTNPPIDAIREKIVTSTLTLFGCEENLLTSSELNCRKIRSNSPILTNTELQKLKSIALEGFKSITLPILFNVNRRSDMEAAVDTICAAADIAIEKGVNIIILSDRGADENKAPIPALLAASGLHHHLIRRGTRMKTSIVLETGEPREVHHFACLIGCGANGVNPYLAFETARALAREKITGLDPDAAEENYRAACTKGIVKIMSKMGISTIQSYQGAQIFEALGIKDSVVEKYFTGTPSRIGGIDCAVIEREALARHGEAFDKSSRKSALKPGGEYKWRANGEYHMFNPVSIYKLQRACRTGDYRLYKEYAAEMNAHSGRLCTIRSMLDIKTIDKPIAIENVESVDSIVKRFKTGAMSYGSISLEAHECLAVAMNRLGGKSNSGEGGENPDRYIPDENGDSRSSAIKQVASGRFGVDINYLNHAKEIQIKMAQGAKPGEGGHLPGGKVYPWIAKARRSTPGVGLISPPPHHDIYSIEDLAQLICDLKNANRDARIAVKLVSEAGVGTIAVGVAKGRADVILISGYDGGTGAAPRTSVRHAGLPWELGIAETHQALLMNNLRNRVVIEADGKLLTGRDVAVAALLGAEEFGFATGPLIALGCVMMRVCNLDTCPVGVATQNPKLRKRFEGKPEYVENFMRFIARDLREYMAKIGVRTVDEMIGHVEFLSRRKTVTNEKAKDVDLSPLLYQPKICTNDFERYHTSNQDHELEKTLDISTLLELCAPALESGRHVTARLGITNIDRVAGTILSSEIARKYGEEGLPDNTIELTFAGSAGQSFGAFLAHGVTLRLEGDSNDYIGKGLSGGRIIAVPDKNSKLVPSENVIIGNVAFYGAVNGEAYICGIAGERFCVRNSGITAVVEGIGDHGCEYMTGGKVAVLGETGRNFAAGMSGGTAFVYDTGDFKSKCTSDLVLLEKLDGDDAAELKEMLENHLKYTGSDAAARILGDFENELARFVKVIPKDYKKVITVLNAELKKGAGKDSALLTAFESVTGKKVGTAETA
ncbi:MAG TPA: glutamate synthase large subunit [Candidatus Ornithomonoglobus intestinigallinarum]|uniref:Glutamate synthase large subunit n=1 Tax=Candidatus Ornithomonoglobus intestinigallinarum TaxID=2840894 RepID=A0A9D1KQQ1_9FIRM|nr:glutamate synthase large subunit [Candidatus Ornithomonoglobus intestinigallinarum]